MKFIFQRSGKGEKNKPLRKAIQIKNSIKKNKLKTNSDIGEFKIPIENSTF